VQPRHRRRWKLAVFAACLLPLGWLLLRAFDLAGPGLGPNPIDVIMDTLGLWGLRLLLLTLAVRPATVLLRKPWILGFRRMLGLFAFFYLSLHFLTWLVLDQWLSLDAVLADIAKRPYITLGFTAFVLLVPLAVTSTAKWMRRLGRHWTRLHQLIYPAAALGCTHFWWQVKADFREPLVYAFVLAVLLGWRAWHARIRHVFHTAMAAANER
jgi:sulfoxide reductase heme-binding subunit YedZ